MGDCVAYLWHKRIRLHFYQKNFTKTGQRSRHKWEALSPPRDARGGPSPQKAADPGGDMMHEEEAFFMVEAQSLACLRGGDITQSEQDPLLVQGHLVKASWG